MKPSTRPSKTIVLPFATQEAYDTMFNDKSTFRQQLWCYFEQHPELFPIDFQHGFSFCGTVTSKKTGFVQRKIRLKSNGMTYQIRPSFMMPYMIATTNEVEKALYLRQWGVPFCGLTYCFGRNDMFWYRAFVSLGRNSVVGTTIKTQKALPEHLCVDEKHSKYFKQKAYIATTVANHCMLGATMCMGAGEQEFTQGYQVFADELKEVESDFTPTTVNTDGWRSTIKAMKVLFPGVLVILCFFHSWLSIRDRCRKVKELMSTIGQKVWHVYQADTLATFSQRLRRLREWAESTLKPGTVQDKVLKLCGKRESFKQAYYYPKAHRTSNAVDRLMDFQDRQLHSMRGFKGLEETTALYLRASCLLWNFHPYQGTPKDGKSRSAFEACNGFQYHDNWLHNLLCAASLRGKRPLHKIR